MNARNTYRLFVLDDADNYHLIETHRCVHIDTAVDRFFPVSENTITDGQDRFEIDCIENRVTMVVDYDFDKFLIEHEDSCSLTYIVTDRVAPLTRNELFA